MQINKQRLQMWLDRKVAAYNDGSSQNIKMIRELCGYRSIIPIPNGESKFYVNGMMSWYTTNTINNIPHKPISWFFEAEEVISDQYQGLFNLMFLKHSLILTITEMDEIIREVNKIKK